jgi:hypothetical protein
MPKSVEKMNGWTDEDLFRRLWFGWDPRWQTSTVSRTTVEWIVRVLRGTIQKGRVVGRGKGWVGIAILVACVGLEKVLDMLFPNAETVQKIDWSNSNGATIFNLPDRADAFIGVKWITTGTVNVGTTLEDPEHQRKSVKIENKSGEDTYIRFARYVNERGNVDQSAEICAIVMLLKNNVSFTVYELNNAQGDARQDSYAIVIGDDDPLTCALVTLRESPAIIRTLPK